MASYSRVSYTVSPLCLHWHCHSAVGCNHWTKSSRTKWVRTFQFRRNISMTKTRWIGTSELFKSTFEVTVRYNTFAQLFQSDVFWSSKVTLADQQVNPDSPLYSAKTFEELGLYVVIVVFLYIVLSRSNVTDVRAKDLLKGIFHMGFDKPSKIQEKALPLLLADPSVSIKLCLLQFPVCWSQAFQRQAYQHDRSITIWDRKNSGFCPHNAQSRWFQFGQTPGKYLFKFFYEKFIPKSMGKS